tara:strand:- start:2292 stop:2537 length:246 start_codon:yes stop_codon:yes gene_type:complete
MKIVTGDFGKDKPTEVTLISKIERAMDKLIQEVGNNTHGTFILLTETDGAVTMSSDLGAEEFNYLLDTVKLNTLLTATLTE